MPTDSILSGIQNLPHMYCAVGSALRMTVNMDADFSLTGKICEVQLKPKELKPLRAFTLTSADSDIAISGQTVTIEIDPTKETSPAFTGGWTLADVQNAGETELALSFYASGGPVDLRLQGDVTWVTKGGEFDNGEAVVAAPTIDVAVTSGVVSVTVSTASPTLDTNTPTSGLSGILKSDGNTLASAVAGTDYLAPGAALVAANNLSDLASASTARSNLGLGTAATTASTAYATAAQGAKADTALQPSYLADQTLSDGATVTYNAASGCNAQWTIGGDRTLSIPTNTTDGMSGRLVITQDGTGGRALTLAAGWGLTTDNLADVAAMVAGAKCVLSWTRITSTTFASTLIFVP